MAENDCLSDATDWIGLDFVERERIPSEIIEKVFVVNIAVSPISNTVTLFDGLGVGRVFQ